MHLQIAVLKTKKVAQTVDMSAFSVSKKKVNEILEAQEIFDNEEFMFAIYDAFIIIFGDTEEELQTKNILLKEF